MTINRGFLNLLNNDYYLDLKSEALNDYIQNSVASHIADKSIHFTMDDILNKIGAVTFLSNDALYKIPVVTPANDQYNNLQISTVNSFIDKLPKHLNGHTLIVELVYGTSDLSILPATNHIVSCNNTAIVFNGFSNGTLIITTNPAPSAAYVGKNINQITNLNLFINDTNNTSQTIKQIINNINNDNISFNDNTAFNIQGTGINNFYSVFSINDTTADTYLYNCSITNTLSAFTTNQIESYKQDNTLPAKDNVYAEFICNSISTDNKIYPVTNNSGLDSLQLNSFNNSIVYKNYTGKYLNYLSTNQSYISFKNEYSQQIRKYLYNYDKLSSNFSICFWGYLREKTNNIPLFSDITDTLSGLYISTNKIYCKTSNILQEYKVSYDQTVNLVNRLCFYTIDFNLVGVDQSINRSCYNIDSNYRLIPKTVQNKAKINVTAYDYSTHNQFICIPDVAYGRSYEQNLAAGYYMSLPQSTVFLTDSSIKFFIEKFNNTYFNGQIRNLMFFNKILTIDEVNSIMNAGIVPSYNWPTQYGNQIKDLISISSYIGALSLYNSNKVNIAKNKFTTSLQ